MRRILSILLLTVAAALISSCTGGFRMWDVDDRSGSPGVRASGPVSAPSRAPLDIPPSLRGEVEVPEADRTVVTGTESAGNTGNTGSVTATAKKVVAGKSVSLDARVYESDAAHLFSSVVDAMTALNLPVQSVDSPSGTVTTGWIRSDSKATNSGLAGFDLFGIGTSSGPVRWRFVVRILRQQVDEGVRSRLEIRTVGQKFTNRHWVNTQTDRNVSAELFSAVEERL